MAAFKAKLTALDSIYVASHIDAAFWTLSNGWRTIASHIRPILARKEKRA